MSSKYWDDFDRRIAETSICLKSGTPIPIRRVAVFITNRCNFKCDYCNVSQSPMEMSRNKFSEIVGKYGNEAIIHITGGEPSVVKWLYDYIDTTPNVRFHLNSNMLLPPPHNLKRLKVSLDTRDSDYFDKIVHYKGAFNRVVANIKQACKSHCLSITCTLTKENYIEAPNFMRWCRRKFPDAYAVFFSVYKGRARRFAFDTESSEDFFGNIIPKLQAEMDTESLALLQETIDEKRRIISGVRFPENLAGKCYISMSERVVDFNGNIWNCSHLFRDGIYHSDNEKCSKCLYGCNRRLVAFNQQVERRIGKSQ